MIERIELNGCLNLISPAEILQNWSPNRWITSQRILEFMARSESKSRSVLWSSRTTVYICLCVGHLWPCTASSVLPLAVCSHGSSQHFLQKIEWIESVKPHGLRRDVREFRSSATSTMGPWYWFEFQLQGFEAESGWIFSSKSTKFLWLLQLVNCMGEPPSCSSASQVPYGTCAPDDVQW